MKLGTSDIFAANFLAANSNVVIMASQRPAFRYLSAWFCPFAHRATLALEHHKGRVDYEWVEALGWFQQEDTKNVTGTGKEWYYHWKADEVSFQRNTTNISLTNRNLRYYS